MAITGLIGFGFVIVHMLGNLQVFLGPEQLDAYAKLLKSNPLVLWGARATLLGAVAVHIVAALQLTHQSTSARPVGYQQWKPQRSSFASRTMKWTGPMLFFFIVYHLLHLTNGVFHKELFHDHQVYRTVVESFSNPLISAAYIIAMLLLSFHLYHGAWSLFQSLGLNHPKYNPLIRSVATLGTVVVIVGNISIPTAILLNREYFERKLKKPIVQKKVHETRFQDSIRTN